MKLSERGGDGERRAVSKSFYIKCLKNPSVYGIFYIAEIGAFETGFPVRDAVTDAAAAANLRTVPGGGLREYFASGGMILNIQNNQFYEGTQAFLFASFSQQDLSAVSPVLEAMERNGYRVWSDTDPQGAWSQQAAQRLSESAAVLFFVTQNALNAPDCIRDVGYAAMCGKAIVLIELEPVELPAGMKAQLSAARSVRLYALQSEEAFCEELARIPELEACKAQPTAQAADTAIFGIGGERGQVNLQETYPGQPSAPAAPAPQSAPGLRCPQCGVELPGNYKFCIKCGAPIADASAAEPQSEYAPVVEEPGGTKEFVMNNQQPAPYAPNVPYPQSDPAQPPHPQNAPYDAPAAEYAPQNYAPDPYGQTPPAQPNYGQDPYAQQNYAPDPYAQQNYAPDPYAQQNYAPDPYAQQNYAPDPYAQQNYAPDPYAQQNYAPDPYAQQNYAPDPYAQQNYAPDPYAPQNYAPDPYAPQNYAPYGAGPYQQPMQSGYMLRRIKTGEEVAVPVGDFVLGRSETMADYVITGNKTIGRKHAMITIQDDGCSIVDLESLNKTRINDIELLPNVSYELNEGDTIGLSNEQFLFYRR